MRRGRVVVVSLGAAFAAVIGVDPAAAQPDAQSAVAAARTAYLEADFDRAASSFEDALAAVDLTRSLAVEAHRHLSVLRFLEGDEPAARRHAAAASALSPEATPPDGASPGSRGLFEEARVGAVALEVGAPEPGVIEARVLPAPPDGLFARLTLSCRDGGGTAAEDEGPPPAVRLAWTSDDTTRCEAAAMTAAGAVLLHAERRIAPERALEAPGASDDDGRDPPVWPWLVAGGVVIAVAVVLAVVLVRNNDPIQIDVEIPGFDR